MLINFYLVLSLILSNIGLSGTSLYFDNLAEEDVSSYQKPSNPLLINLRAQDLSPWGTKVAGLEPKVNAKEAIAIDIGNGQILFDLNSKEVLPLASLTKIMTGILALEEINDFNAEVTISREAALIEGSRMNLWMGEKISLRDVLYGLILKSGNDAAATLEEYYNQNKSPNDPNFVDLMNQKAKEMGLNSMNFEDSSGISENNKANGRDLALLLGYAMKNNTFAQIMATPSYTGRALNGSLEHPMNTTNRLLRTRADVLSGKTGYSEAAGYNFICLFKNQKNHQIVTVVFNTSGHDERFNETNKIIDWVNSSYRW